MERRRGSGMEPGRAAEGRTLDRDRRDGSSGGNSKGRGEAGGRGRPGRYGWLFGLLAGAVFLGIGAARGELAAIWQKAVMICMECIGIG